MRSVFLWLGCALLFSLGACEMSSPPTVAVPPSAGNAELNARDAHLVEQQAMEKGSMDFSNLVIVRLKSNGELLEVTSVLPATVAEAKLSGQPAKTIFRVNANGSGLVIFSRDALNGKSFRTELLFSELEQTRSFSFPVVQPAGDLVQRSFTLDGVFRPK